MGFKIETKPAATIAEMTPSAIIQALPKQTIVTMVMQLTGGSANPNVVEHYVDRIKEEGCWLKSG